MTAAKTYLGDAVYADWNGYHVVLTANPGGDEQTIYLEPEVLEGLARYVAALSAEATP